MLNLRLVPAVSRITLPEITFPSKYPLRVNLQISKLINDKSNINRLIQNLIKL